MNTSTAGPTVVCKYFVPSNNNTVKIQIIFKTFLFLIFATTSYAQTKGWSKDEEQFYVTMKSLCEHFKNQSYDTSQRDFVFNQFVYFDYVLNDTAKARIQKRIILFDDLFSQMNHFVDSIGLENLDAKPTIFFKDNKTFFEPYEKGGELNGHLPLTLTYFDKRRPTEPLGTLLFEAKTHKLVAWILINQGGYRYFLTFNLV